MRRFVAAICLAATSCATLQWGEFDGQRTRMSDPDVYDVVVVAVDGMAQFDGRTNQRLKPGPHLLELASAKRAGHGGVSTVPFPINVKPCTRYSFVAKYRSRTNIDAWDLVPTGETLMAGCETAPVK